MPLPKKKRGNHNLPVTDVDERSGMTPTLHDQIAQRAYALYERRGRLDGFDLQDWLKAEWEVLTENTIH